MSPRLSTTVLAIGLGAVSIPAHAQYVPLWMVAAALSPILVLVLCLVLGLVTRSFRVGARHAAFVVNWVVLFILASYFVENDYVIWTPLALYVLHSILLSVLIIVGICRRIAGRTRAG